MQQLGRGYNVRVFARVISVGKFILLSTQNLSSDTNSARIRVQMFHT